MDITKIGVKDIVWLCSSAADNKGYGQRLVPWLDGPTCGRRTKATQVSAVSRTYLGASRYSFGSSRHPDVRSTIASWIRLINKRRVHIVDAEQHLDALNHDSTCDITSTDDGCQPNILSWREWAGDGEPELESAGFQHMA
jgi:hypothetical protein